MSSRFLPYAQAPRRVGRLRVLPHRRRHRRPHRTGARAPRRDRCVGSGNCSRPTTAARPTRSIVAFADAVARFDIPMQAALDLLRGARMDITVDRYATYEALSDYCYLVASTVGVMMMPVLGSMLDRCALEHAVTLGRAMQMTNILRDVGEDAEHGPHLSAGRRHGALRLHGRRSVRARTIDARFVGLMRFQIARARRSTRCGTGHREAAAREPLRRALGVASLSRHSRCDRSERVQRLHDARIRPAHAKISTALSLILRSY